MSLFPAARSSSKSFVLAVSITSSLMRFMIWFFRSRTDLPLSDAHGESQPSFGRTCRPQRESGETPPQRSYRRSARPRSCQRLSFALRRSGPGFGGFLALASSLRQMNLPPAPSNPQAIGPARRPTATAAAIIVVNSPTPDAAKPALATESPVLSVYDIRPPPVFLIQRCSEVPLLLV